MLWIIGFGIGFLVGLLIRYFYLSILSSRIQQAYNEAWDEAIEMQRKKGETLNLTTTRQVDNAELNRSLRHLASREQLHEERLHRRSQSMGLFDNMLVIVPDTLNQSSGDSGHSTCDSGFSGDSGSCCDSGSSDCGSCGCD